MWCRNLLTPIHLAAYHNHLEIVQFLVPLVKNPFSRNGHGWNASLIAGKRGHSEIVEYLWNLYRDKFLDSINPLDRNVLHKVNEENHQFKENDFSMLIYWIYYAFFMIMFVLIFSHFAYED